MRFISKKYFLRRKKAKESVQFSTTFAFSPAATFIPILFKEKIIVTNKNFIFMLRRFLHFDSFLTSDFKKPTCFTFI